MCLCLRVVCGGLACRGVRIVCRAPAPRVLWFCVLRCVFLLCALRVVFGACFVIASRELRGALCACAGVRRVCCIVCFVRLRL